MCCVFLLTHLHTIDSFFFLMNRDTNIDETAYDTDESEQDDLALYLETWMNDMNAHQPVVDVERVEKCEKHLQILHEMGTSITCAVFNTMMQDFVRIGFLGNSGTGKTTTLNHLLLLHDEHKHREQAGIELFPTSSSDDCTSTICECIGWKYETFSMVVEFVSLQTWIDWIENATQQWQTRLEHPNDSKLCARATKMIDNVETMLRCFWTRPSLILLLHCDEQGVPTATHWSRQTPTSLLPPSIMHDIYMDQTSSANHHDKPLQRILSFTTHAEVYQAMIQYSAASHTPFRREKKRGRQPHEANICNTQSLEESKTRMANESSLLWPLVNKITLFGPFKQLYKYGYSLVDIPCSNNIQLRHDRYKVGYDMCHVHGYFSDLRYISIARALTLDDHPKCVIVTCALAKKEFPTPSIVNNCLNPEDAMSEEDKRSELKIFPIENENLFHSSSSPHCDTSEQQKLQLLQILSHYFACVAHNCRNNL